jgi:hypothetical protein
MQRVLDLDLDAFVYGSEHFRSSDAPRLNADEHPPWDLAKVVDFLESRCLIRDRLPGFAVEHHGDLFFQWRDAIERGLLVPPFHVTHVDAHADLGLGDSGYIYLLTELLREPVEGRRNVRVGEDALGDGNYLAFAIANRWIAELTFAIGGGWEDLDDEADYPWTPSDLLIYLLDNFDRWSRTIRLPLLDAQNLQDNLAYTDRLKPLALEPPVPFTWEVCQRFQAAAPYDVICLARSPAFTPASADLIYDEIRTRFIDERANAGS